jgi:hypothetical protein
MTLLLARSADWRSLRFPPLLGGKQTLGKLPENDAHDPQRKSAVVFNDASLSGLCFMRQLAIGEIGEHREWQHPDAG